jgi:uncharacterized protein YyaL (SSP411 family)
MLDDYAFVTWGLLELHQSTLEQRFIHAALRLMHRAVEDFWSEDRGGFYLPPATGADVPVRRIDFSDGALPSGNAIAQLSLRRLAALTGDKEMERKASRILAGAGHEVRRFPAGYTGLLLGLQCESGQTEVVIVGRREGEDTRRLLDALRSEFLPFVSVHLRDPSADADAGAGPGMAPYMREMRPIGSAATAYVCRNRTCNRPTTSVSEMLKQLKA